MYPISNTKDDLHIGNTHVSTIAKPTKLYSPTTHIYNIKQNKHAHGHSKQTNKQMQK